MSNAPYIQRKLRAGAGYGHVTTEDLVLADGLTDAYDNIHMVCMANSPRAFSSSPPSLPLLFPLLSPSAVPPSLPRSLCPTSFSSSFPSCPLFLISVCHRGLQGLCGEDSAEKLGITREECDAFAIEVWRHCCVYAAFAWQGHPHAQPCV